MKFSWLKKAGTVVKAGVKVVDKYGPQIMAFVSTGCFIGSIIFAVKESPKAREALEEKEDAGQELNLLEKGATVVSNMPWTFALAGGGLALQIGSWVKESARIAAMTGLIATQVKDNETLIEAAKQVVGPEKTEEILEKKETIKLEESKEKAKDGFLNWQYYPFCFQTGDTIWMTWRQFDERHRDSIKQLATNQSLSLYDYMDNMKSDNPPLLDLGWSCEGGGASPEDYLRWAEEELNYDYEMIEFNRDAKCPGFRITWKNIPTPAYQE